jgi:hypothetical protein
MSRPRFRRSRPLLPGCALFRPLLLGCALFGCILSTAAAAVAQQADSTARDPVKVRAPSPRAAVLRSAVLPGWGQWTNGQKVKSVLVLGGGAGLLANAYFQNRLALRSGSPDEKEFYRNNRSQSIWWFAGLYFLNLADAYVDAELWSFDAGPDLTEGIDPAIRARVALRLDW